MIINKFLCNKLFGDHSFACIYQIIKTREVNLAYFFTIPI